MKKYLSDHLKNLRGWKTKRKLVAFAVDDYGNVRLRSKGSRQRLVDGGLELSSQMDKYDSLETRADLEALYEVLQSVRDKAGRPARFTAYAMSANIDFEKVSEPGDCYAYETVAETFSRLAADQKQAYDGVWALWEEGRRKGLIHPQFHGREHLNVELIENKLRSRARDLKVNIENQCLAGLTEVPAMPGVGFTHAFGLSQKSSLDRHREIILHGLDLFESVWGFRSSTFTPPSDQLHPDLYATLVTGGVRAINKPLHAVRRLGDGDHCREFNHSGVKKGQAHASFVRNGVFEPGKEMGFDPIDRVLAQISAAFWWKRPAIISSHRVNFCGHIDESNRRHGLAMLGDLLRRIVTKWPDVEFVSVDEIVDALI